MFNFSKKETNATTISYERINFRKDFKNNGYVKKVLCLYEKLSDNGDVSDVVYFNDRETTEIPCIDKEVFIISDYNEEINSYTLVQIDFLNTLKYRILMTANSKESKNPKGEIYKYMREKNLVEIKKKSKEKSSQIDFGYGNMFIEVLEHIKESTLKDNLYREAGLSELIVENRCFSVRFLDYEKRIDQKETSVIVFRNRVEGFLNLIYSNFKKDTLTIQDVLEKAKVYQENYYYNI